MNTEPHYNMIEIPLLFFNHPKYRSIALENIFYQKKTLTKLKNEKCKGNLHETIIQIGIRSYA